MNADECRTFGLKNTARQYDKLFIRNKRTITDNPKLAIQLSGHTDNVGQPRDNLLLSEQRARAVVDYLTKKGIVPTRLSAKGYGETKPLADNATEAGKAQNRRTELLVTGN